MKVVLLCSDLWWMSACNIKCHVKSKYFNVAGCLIVVYSWFLSPPNENIPSPTNGVWGLWFHPAHSSVCPYFNFGSIFRKPMGRFLPCTHTSLFNLLYFAGYSTHLCIVLGTSTHAQMPKIGLHSPHFVTMP